MDTSFTVPEAALPYIALHRTQLRGDLRAEYARSVAEDYELISPVLPAKAQATLDIGCGMAGIDVLLWRHYRNPVINLLDGTGDTPVRVLYHPTMSPYNSMAVARELLEGNGVPRERIVEWAPDPALTLPQCDLVVSLLSWGFHYPVSTYLPLVERCLRPGGRLIIDVRRGFGGLDELDQRLWCVEIVSSTPKFDRACYEMPEH
jgi:SAM-dependent methyltransferase